MYKIVNSVSILNSEEGIRRIVLNKYPEYAGRDIAAAVKEIYRMRRLFFFNHISRIIDVLSFVISFIILFPLLKSSDKEYSDSFAILFILLFFALYFIFDLIFGPSHDDNKIKKDSNNDRNKWYNRELFSKKQPNDSDTN